MSDVETKQADLRAEMEVTYERLKITSIFFCIGWALFFIFMIGFSYVPGFNTQLVSIFSFGGWAISGGPLISRMLKNKSLKRAFALPDWRVITTYRDGTQKRDYGMETAMNMGSYLVLLLKVFALIAVGLIVTLIYLVFLNIKYFVLYLRVNEKPVLLNSGILLAIICLAVAIGGLSLGVGIQKIGLAQVRSAAASELRELETNIPVGSTAVVRSNFTSLYNDPDIWEGDAESIRDLSFGDTVIVRAHRQGEDRDMWRVDHNGTIGYVEATRLRPNN